MMLKYLAIFAVVIGLTGYVTIQDEQYADDSTQESAQFHNPITSSGAHQEEAQHNVTKPKRHPPGWHSFFTWPNGTGDHEIRWEFKLLLVNTGGTTAILKPWTVQTEWISKDKTSLRNEYIVDEVKTLAAGENRTIYLEVTNHVVFGTNMCLLEKSVAAGRVQDNRPVCSGTITYLDENGCARTTRFMRGWRHSDVRFVASSDPELEYAD